MKQLSDQSEDLFEHMRSRIDPLYQDRIGRSPWMDVHYTHSWRPPTDVFETDTSIVVRIEAAGMAQSDFQVALRDRLLIVTGYRQDPSTKVAYHQLEVRYGEFRVEVFLHWAIEYAGVEAVYDNGFLHLTLPKAQKRQIPIVDSET